MTVVFENEYEEEALESLFSFDYKKVAADVIERVADQELCPYEISVEVIFTSDEEIRQINREQRGIDRVTDVLSFPMVDYPAPADYTTLEENENEYCFDPDSGELLLGDIVLSIPRTVAQAEEYGHSRKREYAFLIAHSMLHLLGYDHMTPEEATEMEQHQEQALNALEIVREREG